MYSPHYTYSTIMHYHYSHHSSHYDFNLNSPLHGSLHSYFFYCILTSARLPQLASPPATFPPRCTLSGSFDICIILLTITYHPRAPIHILASRRNFRINFHNRTRSHQTHAQLHRPCCQSQPWTSRKIWCRNQRRGRGLRF